MEFMTHGHNSVPIFRLIETIQFSHTCPWFKVTFSPARGWEKSSFYNLYWWDVTYAYLCQILDSESDKPCL